MTRFEAYLSDAKSIYKSTEWYGVSGEAFDNLEAAKTYAAAISLVSGVEDITDPEKDGPNSFGMYVVWCKPVSALSCGVVRSIKKAFAL